MQKKKWPRKKQRSTSQEYTPRHAVTAITDLSFLEKEILYNLPESLKNNTIHKKSQCQVEESLSVRKISGKKTKPHLKYEKHVV